MVNLELSECIGFSEKIWLTFAHILFRAQKHGAMVTLHINNGKW